MKYIKYLTQLINILFDQDCSEYVYCNLWSIFLLLLFVCLPVVECTVVEMFDTDKCNRSDVTSCSHVVYILHVYCFESGVRVHDFW